MISIFVRELSSAGLSAAQIVSVRSIGAALMLGLPLLCKDYRALRIKWRDCWCFIGTGIGSIVLFNYCYFATIQRTSVSVAVILLYTSPLFVTLLSRVLFGERLSLRKIIALAMVFAGCVMVSGVCGGGARLSTSGLLLGLCAGLTYALYSIFGRYAQQRGYSATAITFWSFMLAAIAVIFITPWLSVCHAFANAPHLWLYLAGLVIISTILPYCFYTAGLTKLELSAASVIVAVEPVTATIIGTIFFREPLTIFIITGIALVLAALWLLAFSPSTRG